MHFQEPVFSISSRFLFVVTYAFSLKIKTTYRLVMWYIGSNHLLGCWHHLSDLWLESQPFHLQLNLLPKHLERQ